MLLSCCLTHIKIFIPRHILNLVYLCPCLGLSLFISYLCDLFFIFIFIFIIINIFSLKQTYLLFCTLLRICPFYLPKIYTFLIAAFAAVIHSDKYKDNSKATNGHLEKIAEIGKQKALIINNSSNGTSSV